MNNKQRMPTKPIDLTPDEVRGMIDRVLRVYGIDPNQVTSQDGWRIIATEKVRVYAGVMDWRPADPVFVIVSPLLEISADMHLPTEFYRLLLDLNNYETRTTRFSMNHNILYLNLIRSIRGLDLVEIHEAIQDVLTVAEKAEPFLNKALPRFRGDSPSGKAQLPNIPMKPKDAEMVGAVLDACDGHGQIIFRTIIERWHRAGHQIDPRATGIGLPVLVDEKKVGLAALRPSIGGGNQILILGWESLRRNANFPDEAIDNFQEAVKKAAQVKITESSGHIYIDKEFTPELAKSVMKSLIELAKTARKSPESSEAPVWPPDLPAIDLKVGKQTLKGIIESLNQCPDETQDIFAFLLAGWNKNGGSIQCKKAGRIYLKFKTREHKFGQYGTQTHQFNLLTLVSPRNDENAYIQTTWDLASGEYAYLDYVPEAVGQYQGTAKALPGFYKKGTTYRITVDKSFEHHHAKLLLDAILRLKSEGGGN
jgi:hypothetical protein